MAWSQALGFPWDWDPFRELDRMQAEVADLFGRANDSYAPGYPPVNVWVNDEAAVVTAELPGVEPEKIDISVVGNRVTLSGSRPAEELKGDERYLRSERGYGEFSRTIGLPFRVQPDQVEARFKDGVLHLKLPKASVERPRKIEIESR